MARLRLFANLREAAGRSSDDIGGDSVGAVLAAAAERYGDEFSNGLQSAKVWVNGDQADASTPVGADDEVAVLPPVSGGATTMVRNPVGLELGLLLFLIVAVAVTNWVSAEMFTTALVLAAATWVLDGVEASWRWETVATAGPGFLGSVIGALAAYRWGAVGLSVGVLVAALIALAWGIVFPVARQIHIASTNVLLATTTAAGVGAFVVLRLGSVELAASGLLVVGVAALAMWAAGRYDLVDPFIVGLVVAPIVGAIAGQVWFDELLPPAAAGLAAGVGLVAGRGFGSLLRDGEVTVVGPYGGSLGELDGVLMAGALYWVVLALIA